MTIRMAESAFVHRAELAASPERFSEAVRPRLLEGMDIHTIDYFGALQKREQLRTAIHSALAAADALLLPTTPVPAPLRGQTEILLERGLSEHRSAFIRLTAPFSVAGLPALTVPLAFDEGLPVGAQLVGAAGADAPLLALGEWLERVISPES
jgi:aspartyl-tRNA(Asn)/glutamyl-tRNA(Gln) amidotransferase subunit A